MSQEKKNHGQRGQLAFLQKIFCQETEQDSREWKISFSVFLTCSERTNVRAGHGLNFGVIGCKIGKYHADHEDVLAYCESNYLFIFLRL